MILFQTREIDCRVVQTLSKFCINSTRIYLEHAAPPEGRKTEMGDIRQKDYQRRTQVSLRLSNQADFQEESISSAEQKAGGND